MSGTGEEQGLLKKLVSKIASKGHREKLMTIAVILVIAIGLPILFVIGLLSDPELVALDKLQDHEGESVTIEGVVIDTSTGKTGALSLTLFGDGVTVTVYIEVASKRVAINDRVRITGEVVRYKTSIQIMAPNDNSLEIVGKWSETFVLIADAERYIDEYVTLEGTVIDISTIGGGRALVEVQAGESRLTTFFHKGFNYQNGAAQSEGDGNTSIQIGDVIRLTGVMEEFGGSPELVVYAPELVTVTAKWTGVIVPLKTIGLNPWDYEYKPIEVEGYIENEPYSFLDSLSFTLLDALEDPAAELKVRNVNMFSVQGMGLTENVTLHKGDYVRVNGRLIYDADDFQFVLDCAVEHESQSTTSDSVVTLLETHGDWYPTFEELASGPYAYERAVVNITGFVLAVDQKGENWTLIVGDASENTSVEVAVHIHAPSNSTFNSLLLSILPDDTVRVAGVVTYTQHELKYVITIDRASGGIWRWAE